jgi:hypothetical protein
MVVISLCCFNSYWFIIFGLFHAIWGQYFYVPFFVENTELHIGPRPKNSIYSGGQTAWQDPEEKEKNLNRFFQNFGMDGLVVELKNYAIGSNFKDLLKKS